MKKLVFQAKTLRKRSTDTEHYLWKFLRSKRLADYKFRRQEPIGNYIVDFVCYEHRLIIECDGGQHLEMEEKDHERDQWFIKQGYRVLRFWDNDIFQKTEVVLEMILNACQTSPSPLSPPIEGGDENYTQRPK